MPDRRSIEKHRQLHPGDYEQLLDIGDGACWICAAEPHERRRLAIDHDHATGAVRGLLCSRCNLLLGYARDDLQVLEKAIAYLKRSRDAYPDSCDGCRDAGVAVEHRIFSPSGVAESRVGWTRFLYQCPRHGQWTCGYQTKGLPWTWSR